MVEDYERDLAAQSSKDVYIVAGGLFDPKPTTVAGKVAVPTKNFRVTVVLEPGQRPADVTPTNTVFAIEIPNGNEVRGHKWPEYQVKIDDVERDSGYDFLATLPDGVEAVLEAR
jgi:endonuclease G